MLSMAGRQVQRLQMGRSKGAIRVGGDLILEGVIFSEVSGAWAVAGAGVADIGFGAVDDDPF